MWSAIKWFVMKVLCYELICCVDVLLTRSVMNVICYVRVCVERVCYKFCRL